MHIHEIGLTMCFHEEGRSDCEIVKTHPLSQTTMSISYETQVE